jgi:MarC family membrane protein
MDSIGNLPIFLALLKDISPQRQRCIIFRELIIAFLIIIAFVFIGDALLDLLGVSEETIMIAGGIILFLISLKMIFPLRKDSEQNGFKNKEPFIVPLAVPLVAGPAVLVTVIIYSQHQNLFILTLSVFIAWAVSTLILLCSSLLKRILGTRGIAACERLMGLILTLIAVQMFLKGLAIFLKKT